MIKVILNDGECFSQRFFISFRMTVLLRSRDLLKGSDDALFKHSLCNLHEAGDVGTLHIVDVAVSLSSVLDASLMDVRHDGMKLLVNLCRTPADMHCVLSHLKT